MDLNLVAHVDKPIRLDAHDDDVRGVEASMDPFLVHGRMRDAHVVRPLVQYEGRAAAQVRHPVVEDEAARVLLVVNELADSDVGAAHDAQRVEVVHEVQHSVLDERHPVFVARHVVLLCRVHHRRAALDLGDGGHVLVVVPHDGEVHLGFV